MNEHERRLESMVNDNGQTWDLSDNDTAAIGWALNVIHSLRKRETFKDVAEEISDLFVGAEPEGDSPNRDWIQSVLIENLEPETL